MNATNTFEKKLSGFTLIELMIVVVIIAVLASIALPYFGEVGRRGHRVEAKDLLLSAASKQEQFFGQYVSYTDVIKPPAACSNEACGLRLADDLSSNNKYKLTIGLSPASCAPKTATPCRGFLLSATVNGGHKDDDCTALTYSSDGVKGAADGAGKITDVDKIKKCWK